MRCGRGGSRLSPPVRTRVDSTPGGLMLTSSVRSCAMLASALAASVVLTAAPVFGQEAAAAPATPQAALDALEAAIAAADARAALALITPDGQKRLTKDAVMGSLAMLAFMDPNDPNPMGPKPSA